MGQPISPVQLQGATLVVLAHGDSRPVRSHPDRAAVSMGTEYGRCLRCHRCASAYVLACDFWRLRARPCCCSLVHRHACVCQCVCACANACVGPMSWHASNARTHTADVLADFCVGDVAPRSRKRSRRLPHAHLRVRIRMRVRLRSCVRESLCLHSHMYAHA